MSVYSEDGDGNPVYSFFNVDQHYDFLLSIGMRPIVELSFMPELLASHANETIFHYKGGISPPAKYQKWANLMVAFVKHLIDRYGLAEISQWDFEVWNEPNCANAASGLALKKNTSTCCSSRTTQSRVFHPS